MGKKTIAVNILVSTIIHIVAVMVLFSFRTSKPLPGSNINIPLVTLVSPQKMPQQSADAQKPQTLPKKQFSKSAKKAEISEFVNNSQNSGIVYDESHENNSGLDITYSELPKALYMPKIPYPRAAKNAKIEGIAEIVYTIDTTGRVVSVKLLSSPHISFEKIIEKSVLSWRFVPATENGKPVSITANQTIVFKLM